MPTTPSAPSRLAAEWDATVEQAYTLGHGPLPAQSEVLGVVNRVSGPRDVVVCAAGSMPGDLHKLWRTRDPKGYHVEYGYSCMGYEIAGGLGVKLAAPDRDVYVMVGDGSFLMMAQEIVTAVQEGVDLRIVLVQNRGFASIGALSESLGSQRFGTKYRTHEDLAKVAEGLGATVVRATTLDELEAGLRAATGVTVVQIETDPLVPAPGLRGVVGRAGGRGLRPRLHARRARDLRREQADPAAVPEPARESHAMTTVDLKTIQHRIGGAETPGSSTRTAPVYDPATGAEQAQVLLAEPADVDAAVAAARTAFETLEGGQRRPPLADHVRVPQPRRAAPRRPRADRRLRARQGRRGRQGRGHPRHGGRRVRVRHPAAAQGRVLRPGLRRRRLVLASASRSASARGSRRSTSR